MRPSFKVLAAVMALSCVSAQALGADNMDAATGYRIANYRAPVTMPPQGGPRVTLQDLDRLRGQGASLVDVMPARAGFDPTTGQWRLMDKRTDIPGSVWLPNVGQGKLDSRLAAYFAGALRDLTKGHTDHPLIFYCMADCWMSWNAVKRAASLGYTKLYWFADGVDGWAEAGRAFAEANPPPVPAMADAK